MFVNFFLELRQNKVPATLREYLTLIEAVKRNVAGYSVEDFYYLSRATLCLLYTSPSPRDQRGSRMPSSA